MKRFDFPVTKEQKKLFASATFNFLLGLVKCVAALLSFSKLFAISGAYSFVLCFARVPFLSKSESKKQQPVPRYLPVLLIILGIICLLYSVHIILTGEIIPYSKTSTYLLGICAIIKLGTSIYSLTMARDSYIEKFFIMKLTNAADGLISLVLTQSAILTLNNVAGAALYNGLFGITAGICIILIGIFLFVHLVREEVNTK